MPPLPHCLVEIPLSNRESVFCRGGSLLPSICADAPLLAPPYLPRGIHHITSHLTVLRAASRCCVAGARAFQLNTTGSVDSGDTAAAAGAIITHSLYGTPLSVYGFYPSDGVVQMMNAVAPATHMVSSRAAGRVYMMGGVNPNSHDSSTGTQGAIDIIRTQIVADGVTMVVSGEGELKHHNHALQHAHSAVQSSPVQSTVRVQCRCDDGSMQRGCATACRGPPFLTAPCYRTPLHAPRTMLTLLRHRRAARWGALVWRKERLY